ncbi:hypothetical protein NX059_002989 [Plenodomus lindquistii]|nr:hypothetical protein NX059_002989 [Plenodomus lindquistii]
MYEETSAFENACQSPDRASGQLDATSQTPSITPTKPLAKRPQAWKTGRGCRNQDVSFSRQDEAFPVRLFCKVAVAQHQQRTKPIYTTLAAVVLIEPCSGNLTIGAMFPQGCPAFVEILALAKVCLGRSTPSTDADPTSVHWPAVQSLKSNPTHPLPG